MVAAVVGISMLVGVTNLRAVTIALLGLATPAYAADRVAVGTQLVSPDTGYSPGVVSGDTLYVSGLQGVDPKSRAIPAEFSRELRFCMDRLLITLRDGGMSEKNIVSVTIYVTDISNFHEVDGLYKSMISRPYPARTVVGVKSLSVGARIEISAIARR